MVKMNNEKMMHEQLKLKANMTTLNLNQINQNFDKQTGYTVVDIYPFNSGDKE